MSTSSSMSGWHCGFRARLMSAPQIAGEHVDLEVQSAAGDVHQRRVEQGSAVDERLRQDRAAAIPVALPPVVVIRGGVGPGRQGFAQAWCAVAGTDVAVPADRVGELHEPAVLLGDLEVDQPAGWTRPRNPLNLLCHSSAPSAGRVQSSRYNFRARRRRRRRQSPACQRPIYGLPAAGR